MLVVRWNWDNANFEWNFLVGLAQVWSQVLWIWGFTPTNHVNRHTKPCAQEWILKKGSNINSLALGRFLFNFRLVILKLTLVNGGWGISYEIALRWMPLDLTDDKSILVQVMAWCCQASSHYLSQCWPRSLMPYGVTRPQWVNNVVVISTKDCPLFQWHIHDGHILKPISMHGCPFITGLRGMHMKLNVKPLV